MHEAADCLVAHVSMGLPFPWSGANALAAVVLQTSQSLVWCLCMQGVQAEQELPCLGHENHVSYFLWGPAVMDFAPSLHADFPLLCRLLWQGLC